MTDEDVGEAVLGQLREAFKRHERSRIRIFVAVCEAISTDLSRPAYQAWFREQVLEEYAPSIDVSRSLRAHGYIRAHIVAKFSKSQKKVQCPCVMCRGWMSLVVSVVLVVGYWVSLSALTTLSVDCVCVCLCSGHSCLPHGN